MKKFTLALVSSLILGAAAWTLSEERPPRTNSSAGPAAAVEASGDILKKIAETTFTTSVIECLESGRIQDARQMLHLRQGSQILALDAMLNGASEDSRRTATLLLRRIAKSNAKWNSEYHGTLPQADTNSALKVESILQKFR